MAAGSAGSRAASSPALEAVGQRRGRWLADKSARPSTPAHGSHALTRESPAKRRGSPGRPLSAGFLLEAREGPAQRRDLPPASRHVDSTPAPPSTPSAGVRVERPLAAWLWNPGRTDYSDSRVASPAPPRWASWRHRRGDSRASARHCAGDFWNPGRVGGGAP